MLVNFLPAGTAATGDEIMQSYKKVWTSGMKSKWNARQQLRLNVPWQTANHGKPVWTKLVLLPLLSLHCSTCFYQVRYKCESTATSCPNCYSHSHSSATMYVMVGVMSISVLLTHAISPLDNAVVLSMHDAISYIMMISKKWKQ